MAWDPTANANVATGDLYTAGLYNLQLGTAGNMAYMGNTHNHATLVGAGGGAYLGNVACLAASVYPLGQRLGASRRIEVKLSAELTALANNSTTVTITWDNAFGTAIEAVLLTVVQSSGNNAFFYGFQLDSMSTTNCVARLFGGFSDKTAKIMAVGIGYD
uniref:Uncharacterized protein n=1 Tax=viral metagenome TaxID=1070528 RepID=A0A6M3X4G1_9ZZZZ